MTINLSGLLLPITTPFTANEDVDMAALKANIGRWNTTGITGYVVLGSTGERVNLDEREYLQVIETARASVPETMTFIIGAGQQSTRGTIAEIQRAAKAGAQAVLVITPHYYRPAITQETLIEHYTTVADAVSIPVILYSMPDLTGIKIEPETIAQLSAHPNIVGIKDSSADIDGFQKTVTLVREDFAVLIGNGTVLSTALQKGARGAILAVGCVAAALCVEIYRLVEVGEGDKAAALQEKLTPLALAVTKRYGIGGLKAAMDIIGFTGGTVRAPLKSASLEAQAEIAALLGELRNEPASKTEAGSERGKFAGSVKP